MWWNRFYTNNNNYSQVIVSSTNFLDDTFYINLKYFLFPLLPAVYSFQNLSWKNKPTNKKINQQSLSIVNYWFHPSASLNCIWDVFKHLPCFFVITDFFNTLPFQVSRYEHFKVKPVKQQVATQERICVPLIYKHWADPKRLFPGKLQYRDVYRVTRTFKNQILKIKYNKNLTLVLWFFIFGR